ncbi:MAG: acyltransferase [Pseudomonadota bacterium]
MTAAESVRGERDEALDGLRGIAALTVVLFHCGVDLHAPPLFMPGFTGVHLFFVLSGYLISRPFWARLSSEQPLPSWRKYAARRFVRIYPTYFVALVVFVAMRFAGHLHAPGFRSVLLHALLVFNWGAPAEFLAINVVMWTLAIEAQFYLIVPIAAAFANRFGPSRGRLGPPLVCIAFVLIGWLSRCLEYSATLPAELRFRLPFSFLDLFAMGMFVSYLELTQVPFLRGRLWLRSALVLCAAGVLFGTNYWFAATGASDWLSPPTLPLVWLYPTFICAGFALILLAVVSRSRYPVAVLTSRPLVFVGRISYSMYLFHVGVGYVLLTQLPRNLGLWLGSHPRLYALAQMGPVLLVSYLAYRAIELPSLRWVESFSLRSRPQKPIRPS